MKLLKPFSRWHNLMPSRVWAALAALAGQPVLYRVVVVGGGVEVRPRPGYGSAMVLECHFLATHEVTALFNAEYPHLASRCWCGLEGCDDDTISGSIEEAK